MDKAQILAEIKRTAQSNGGTPLGVRAFHAETGFRGSDWQRFWPRFSDAVREAGYEPNAFKKDGYEKAELLDHYARLALEIGTLPTHNDLVFKSHNDPAFPSTKPFRRLGGKSQIVKELIAHCRGRPEFQRLVELCDHYSPKEQIAPAEGKPNESQDGFVYMEKHGRYYKIGHTNSLGRREYEIGLKLPEKLRRIHSIRTDDPSGIEKYWLNRFDEKHVNGEWFNLSPADVAAFKRRTFM